jgi:chromosome segregation ATPase
VSEKVAALQTLQGIFMIPKEVLTQALKVLEEEYRFWLVETIRMERGIETMEEEIQQHNEELGAERVVDIRRHLSHIRRQHDELEERIRSVRRRLDEYWGRVEQIP